MSIFKDDDIEKKQKYKYLDEYTSFLKKMERPLIGREEEMAKLLAAMQRPELCNVILLAAAGSGKTALVQGTMLKDSGRAYLEVNLPKMIANLKNENEMADKLIAHIEYPEKTVVDTRTISGYVFHGDSLKPI
jgi:hypothetical protein